MVSDGYRQTYHATETIGVPLSTKSLDHHIRDGTSAFPAFRRVPIGVAIDAPSITVFLHKRGGGVERLCWVLASVWEPVGILMEWITHISALGAKEMSNVPFSTASNHHLTLNGRLAAAASRAEELVEVEMTVES